MADYCLGRYARPRDLSNRPGRVEVFEDLSSTLERERHNVSIKKHPPLFLSVSDQGLSRNGILYYCLEDIVHGVLWEGRGWRSPAAGSAWDKRGGTAAGGTLQRNAARLENTPGEERGREM